MKAVVFTTDAIFAMIIASVAITFLIYFTYAPPTPSFISYSRTQSILNTMLSIQVGSIANGSQIAAQVVNQGRASGSTWMQYKGNSSRDAGLLFGPLSPSMEYRFNSWGAPSLPLLAAYGNIYFAVGNTLGAINASSGVFLWNATVGSTPSGAALYNNLFIYSNTVAVGAIYANTGSSAWIATTTSAVPSSPILLYNGYEIFGTTSNTINAYYANNGVLAWSSSPGFEATSLAVANGSIAAVSSVGGLGLITGSGILIWYNTPSGSVCAGGSATFSAAGSNSVTVPTGCTSANLQLWGGGGGGASPGGGAPSTGGGAGYITGTVAVTPGNILYLYVASGGASNGYGGSGAGGDGGGSGNWGAGGGGCSAASFSSLSSSLSSSFIVAAGGGGASYGGVQGYNSLSGGAGGSASGSGGASGSGYVGGGGGTSSGGGTGYSNGGATGSSFQGGNSNYGGAGGCGYYGGGGGGGSSSGGNAGIGAGGGGGSSWASNSIAGVVNTGGSGSAAGNPSGTIGQGGASTNNGNAGEVIVSWSSSGFSSVTTDISTLNNIIAYGSGTNACAAYVSGSVSFCYSVGSNAVTGVSIVNNILLYQTGNSIMALTPSGSTIWSKSIPSFGQSSNYPVTSGKFAYAAWAGSSAMANTLTAFNLSTGSTAWVTSVPYGIGSMILAYGRLYAISGNGIMAYGGCNANAQSSLLDAAVNLYANGDGSCADALLNSVYPMSNSSLYMNSSFLPEARLENFNGIGQIAATSSNILSNYGQGLTYVAWFNTTSTTTTQGIVSQGVNSGQHSALFLAANQLECGVVDSAGPSGTTNVIVPVTINPRTWYQGGLTFNVITGTLSCYLNGALSLNVTEAYGTYGNNNALTIGNYLGNFNGIISGVQVYDQALSPPQMTALYQEGMQGGAYLGNTLVAWYPLDGDANDYSVYNNTAYPINVIYEYTGYRPASLRNAFQLSRSTAILPVSSYVGQFNGASSYISTGSSGLPIGSGSFSSFSWIKTPGSVNGNNMGIFYSGTQSLGESWYYMVTPSNTVIFDLFSVGGPASTATVANNQWHFVGVVNNGGTVRMYVDGLASGSPQTMSPNTVLSTTYIGQSYPGSARYFNGLISNVQVYNTALSPAQVLQLYQEGIGGEPVVPSNIVGWWPLNGNPNDYSGQGNNGNINHINYSLISNLYNVGVYSWK
jgi:hypothetical protein